MNSTTPNSYKESRLQYNKEASDGCASRAVTTLCMSTSLSCMPRKTRKNTHTLPFFNFFGCCHSNFNACKQIDSNPFFSNVVLSMLHHTGSLTKLKKTRCKLKPQSPTTCLSSLSHWLLEGHAMRGRGKIPPPLRPGQNGTYHIGRSETKVARA